MDKPSNGSAEVVVTDEEVDHIYDALELHSFLRSYVREVLESFLAKRAAPRSVDSCEVCGDVLLPEPMRCEQHAHTEPGDDEWEKHAEHADSRVLASAPAPEQSAAPRFALTTEVHSAMCHLRSRCDTSSSTTTVDVKPLNEVVRIVESAIASTQEPALSAMERMAVETAFRRGQHTLPGDVLGALRGLFLRTAPAPTLRTPDELAEAIRTWGGEDAGARLALDELVALAKRGQGDE